MRLFNTLTRTEEEFVPADGKTVRMYTCGLTVYSRGHIGNFRTFVSLDVLRRALRHQEGYAMRHVMNSRKWTTRPSRHRSRGGSLRGYTDVTLRLPADSAVLAWSPWRRIRAPPTRTPQGMSGYKSVEGRGVKV